MKRWAEQLKSLSVLSILALLAMPMGAQAFDLDIVVAPNVLNIQSEGKVVTVHTDIAYSAVDVYTVFLNEVPIDSWKADNRGNFVAKFIMSDVKQLDGLHIGDYTTLKLTGATWSGEAFFGDDEVMVVDNVPSGR